MLRKVKANRNAAFCNAVITGERPWQALTDGPFWRRYACHRRLSGSLRLGRRRSEGISPIALDEPPAPASRVFSPTSYFRTLIAMSQPYRSAAVLLATISRLCCIQDRKLAVLVCS